MGTALGNGDVLTAGGTNRSLAAGVSGTGGGESAIYAYITKLYSFNALVTPYTVRC